VYFLFYLSLLLKDFNTGQWDYGNKWSQDGCGNGDCLRSHVNLTETLYTLAMITKAKVPTNKITVGVSSYGRSFGMTKAGCTGPMCTYGGPDSTASEGECTQTAGYISNAEILDIVYSNDSALSVDSWYDTDTDSNYLVYNQTQWVAYMTDDVKTSRINRWKGLNFAGTVDWAVDLAYHTGDDGDPDDDCSDCEDNQTPNHPWTPCDDNIGSLDELSDDTINGWPVHCRAQYLLQALSGLLTEATANFTDLMKEHYDSKFKVYSKAVSKSALSQVHDFMMDHGNDYFTCQVTEFQLCCGSCSGGKSQCRYCFDGTCYKNYKRDLLAAEEESMNTALNLLESRGDYDPQNNRRPIVKWENITQPCPPDYSGRGYGPDNPYEQTVYWTLNPDKRDAFFADILNATGIPSNKIGFGLYTDMDACEGSGHKVGDGDDCWNTGYEFGAPFPNGYGAADVTNPKDLAQKGLENAANLPDQINNVVSSMQALAYPDDGFKVVDAVSLPIMMLAQGVESMQLVVNTADKIEEEERKAIILAFIGAILFFVPIAGEVLGAVTEMADISAIIAVLGAAGNAAFDVYTIVDDPKNAPLAIVDLIMAPLALADVAVIAKAAEIRRGMSAEDLAKLGDRVGERMGKVEKVTGVCRKSE
jgi:chitinase